MQARPIQTAEEHQPACAELERLMNRNPAASSADAERLEILALQVENYEREHFDLGAPDPASAMRFRMDQRG